MLQFEELKRELHEKQAALEDLKDALGLERLREEVEMLENKAAEPGFWDNMEAAQKVLPYEKYLRQAAADYQFTKLENYVKNYLTQEESK